MLSTTSRLGEDFEKVAFSEGEVQPALLSRWRTASGLPRFEPLTVNNARTELPARPCMYMRRSTAVNQATAPHGEHTMPSASPRTHTQREHIHTNTGT